jgi:hypothetical protein
MWIIACSGRRVEVRAASRFWFVPEDPALE